MPLLSQDDLIAACLALLSGKEKLSKPESALLRSAGDAKAKPREVADLRKAIRAGDDPLGEAFCSIRSGDERRGMGAVYTPAPIVTSMVSWLRENGDPALVVDPGSGSGRFILEAARTFPHARLIAVELDPLAALMLRASLAATGFSERAEVLVQDFRKVRLPKERGQVAFVGNPPYVRHHDIGAKWKAWYGEGFAKLGIKASALAGLHAHFFLRVAQLAKPGDLGAFITSSEWMDVNYGSALRKLLVGPLGATGLHALEPKVEAFPGTATTAAITTFKVGEQTAPIIARSVADLPSLNGLSKGEVVERDRFKAQARWSSIAKPGEEALEGYIELGELFRVHRGQVTGANSVWIEGTHALGLPESALYPSITKAKDLIDAGALLVSGRALRRIIDLPPELDEFSATERRRIDAFLKWAKSQGADQTYIAQHRRAWWSVGLKDPAPILCTYMARRPPQFTFNACGARHINIAHGLYPREPLSQEVLTRIVAWLNGNVVQGDGRTYAGGLTKFEPREIERLKMPSLGVFAQ